MFKDRNSKDYITCFPEYLLMCPEQHAEVMSSLDKPYAVARNCTLIFGRQEIIQVYLFSPHSG